MCIAGGLGIPASTPQRTPKRNCFVSIKNRLCATAWGLLRAEWEKNLTDLLAYSLKFEITLDNCELLCTSSNRGGTPIYGLYRYVQRNRV